MLIYQTCKFWTLPIFPLPKKKLKKPCVPSSCQGAIWLSSTELAKHKLWGASSVTCQGSNIHFGVQLQTIGGVVSLPPIPFLPYSWFFRGKWVEYLQNDRFRPSFSRSFSKKNHDYGRKMEKGKSCSSVENGPYKGKDRLGGTPPWYWKMCCVLKNRTSLPNTAPSPQIKKKDSLAVSHLKTRPKPKLKRLVFQQQKPFSGAFAVGFREESTHENRPHLQRPKCHPRPTPPR